MSLTQARLKKLLRYNPKMGEFYWLGPTDRTKKAGARAGCLDSAGYWVIRIGGKNYKGHRLAWLYVYGKFPKYLDHKRHNIASCRIADLREATHGQNMQNKKSYGRSGYKGVRYHAGKWEANIKHIYLGRFCTPQAAHAAYCHAAKKLYGKFFNAG